MHVRMPALFECPKVRLHIGRSSHSTGSIDMASSGLDHAQDNHTGPNPTKHDKVVHHAYPAVCDDLLGLALEAGHEAVRVVRQRMEEHHAGGAVAPDAKGAALPRRARSAGLTAKHLHLAVYAAAEAKGNKSALRLKCQCLGLG